MRRAAKMLVVYVMLAMTITLVVGSARLFPSYRLANAGENTVGLVTKLNPELHNSYTYVFTVADRTYEKRAWAYPGVRVGDAVPVVYLPADPGVSDVGDVAAAFRHELELVSVAATVLPAFFVWRMWRSN